MARRTIVIEDTDDELPELAVLLKAKHSTPITDAVGNTKVANTKVAGEREKGGEGVKPRRRRVLNGVSDNPLLRPLGREVGREKERMGKGKGRGKEAVGGLVAAGGFASGVGVGVVGEEVMARRKARNPRTAALGVQGKLDEARGVNNTGMLGGGGGSFKDGMEGVKRDGGRRVESLGGILECREEERMGSQMSGRAAVGNLPAAAGEVDDVAEGLEGLLLDGEEDVVEPRVRKVRGKPVADVLRSEAEDEEEEEEEEEEDSPVVGARPRRRMGKPAVVVRAETPEEEEEELVEDEEDDMSDFIVSDDSSVEEEEEEELSPMPAPKSVRKLVRGRRPDTLSKPEAPEVKDAQALLLDWSDDDTKEESVAPRPVIKRLFPTEKDRGTKDFEEECPILTYDPPTSKASRKPAKKTITTPPPSPKKSLTSPKKLPRIPTATHSPSADDFWKASVINDWNDEFSPQKPLRLFHLSDDLAGSLPKAVHAKKDKALLERKKQFNESKHAVALSFLRELDDEITDGKVSALAASTGGVSIVWSKKLNTTAGRANWKREAIRSRPALGSSGAPTTTYRHHASIELAEKVIDDTDRLLNVVAHEFCHLANFMVSGVTTNPHGKEFKAWAARCSARFGGRGIEVTTKHGYEIDFKYVWRCARGGCGLEFKRHSRSIDPKRHSCGACKGRLVQVRPVPRGGGEGGEKVMGEYQAYVRDNIGRVRRENVGSPQKDVMALVGRGYRELKAERLRGLGKSSLSVDSSGNDGAKDGKDLEDPVEDMVKKIDFLDLTTP
ncbi:hypothetical protein ACLOAV_000171 [Pseudogymnoascus australis]